MCQGAWGRGRRGHPLPGGHSPLRTDSEAQTQLHGTWNARRGEGAIKEGFPEEVSPVGAERVRLSHPEVARELCKGRDGAGCLG